MCARERGVCVCVCATYIDEMKASRRWGDGIGIVPYAIYSPTYSYIIKPFPCLLQVKSSYMHAFFFFFFFSEEEDENEEEAATCFSVY